MEKPPFCATCNAEVGSLRHETCHELVAALREKINTAIRTGDVCVLHDGGTSEGCYGCFDERDAHIVALEANEKVWMKAAADRDLAQARVKVTEEALREIAECDGCHCQRRARAALTAHPEPKPEQPKPDAGTPCDKCGALPCYEHSRETRLK